ncbi:MAG: EAL domain-containing protein [Reinekea sp.]
MEEYKKCILNILDEHSLVHYILLDETQNVRYVSQSMTKICQRRYLDLIHTPLRHLPLFFSHRLSDAEPFGERLIATEFDPKQFDSSQVHHLVNTTGTTFDFCIGIFPVLLDQFNGQLIILIDQHSTLEVKYNAELFNLLLSENNSAVFLVDKNVNIVRVNEAFTAITGYTEDEVKGKNPSMLGGGFNNVDFYKKMWCQLLTHNRWQGVLINRHKSGDALSVQATLRVLRNSLDQIIGYLAVYDDQKVKSRASQEMSFDELTALPGLRILTERLKLAIGYAHRHQKHVLVLSINLDNFQQVNSRFGEQVGDEFLKKTAWSINNAIRAEDAVARVIGDDFQVMIAGLSSEQEADGFITQLRNVLAEPKIINETRIALSASIGYTMFPYDSASANQLLRHAVHALDIAKTEGGDFTVRYSCEPSQRKASLRQFREQILDALESDRMLLFVQPQYDARNRKLRGVEMQIRWNTEGGLLEAVDFLAQQKNPELWIPIDRWRIQTTIDLLQGKLADLVAQNLKISLNVSPYSLQDKNFRRWLLDKLAMVPVVIRSLLELEIQETHSDMHIADIQSLIRDTSPHGLSFALDDFGMGSASLQVFNQLDVTMIKIDKRLIRGMDVDHKNLMMVSVICSMAKKYNRDVIADGIEYSEQIDILNGIGCNVVQGSGIARALSVDDFLHWMRTMPVTHYLNP